MLYECKRGECGPFENYGISRKSGNYKYNSLATFLRSYERLGMEEWRSGFCATTSPISDQRYQVAELPDVGTYISIHTYSLKKRIDYNNCDALKGRTVAVVDIIEGKPLEKNMVVVKASDMAKEISAKGSVSLYGIFFDINKYSVKEESEAMLQEIAKLVKQQGGMQLLVVGHTDNAGTFEYNKELSENRALAVVRVLIRKYVVSPGRLTPVGASFSSPVSSNATEKGRALNRRVELVENRDK